jgi:hypothetical protein
VPVMMCLIGTLSTTNLTWTTVGLNVGLCGEKAVATNLSRHTISVADSLFQD